MTLHKAKQFSVDSDGAYLVDLYDAAGQPILFPRTMIGDKRRGGAHVCYPYFGADAAGALPQHGFGRDVEWEVDTEFINDNEIGCWYFPQDETGAFQGLTTTILYKLNPEINEFFTSIVISNPSKRLGPQPVSPGFHPYFAVDSSDVKLNGEKISLADFEPYKEYPNTSSMTIESGGRTITVSSNDLQHMVVWSDAKGDYLCVEPTLSGHSFDSSRSDNNMLEAASHVQYGYTISWS